MDELASVAVLFSGGKDSCQAVQWCIREGHDVERLITVQPKSPEAYLWHFATTQLTPLSAEAMELDHVLLETDAIGAQAESEALDPVFDELDVDAVAMGGVGLQHSQIGAVGEVAARHGIDVWVPHEGRDHYELFQQAVEDDFDIRVTQVAAMGLGHQWLGLRIDEELLEKLKETSEEYGFHVGLEGGPAETFVADAPFFEKRVRFKETEKVWDSKTESGYLEVKDAELLHKEPVTA